MENKDLIPYKESIFDKIKKKIISLFTSEKSKEVEKEIVLEQPRENTTKEESFSVGQKEFRNEIKTQEDPERQRIIELRRKYDNKEISSKDISLEDMDKIIELYNEDTAKINEDITRRKESIARMLKEMQETA